MLGLVDNTSFNGCMTRNPYEFKHYNVNFLSLYVDGVQVPSKPLTPSFADEQYLRSYITLFEGTGMLHDNRGHGISREDFKEGFALYAFDLTPDMAEGSHVDPIKHGTIRLDIHFKEALRETVNVVLYSEYDNLIQIDRARNIVVDY